MYDGPGAFKNKDGTPQRSPAAPSLRITEGALKSHSKDIQKARLVVTYLGDIGVWNIRPTPGSDSEKGQLAKTPDAAGRFKWVDSLPHRIDCHFAKGVMVDGVEFDYLRPGGLMLDDLDQRGGFKNVFFGPHCEAKGDANYSQQALDRSGQY